jgi:hypothetical protein
MNAKDKTIAAGLALVVAGSVSAQFTQRGATVQESSGVATRHGDTSPVAGGETLREIDDPATGKFWLVLRDPKHPAGPGRLVLADKGYLLDKKKDRVSARVSVHEQAVIHTGDLLTIEEHTAFADTRLQAIALGPATKNAFLRARLMIGGKVVRAEAVSPGHAVFAPEIEVRP